MLLIGMAILMDLKLLKKNHTWEELWSVLPLTLSIGYFAAYYYELFKLPYAKKYDKFQIFILYALYIAASAFLIMLFGLLTPSINYNFSGIYSLLGGFLGGELFKFFNTSQWKKWKSKTLPILIQCAIFLLIIFLLIILYIDSEIKQSKNFNICDIFRIDLLTFLYFFLLFSVHYYYHYIIFLLNITAKMNQIKPIINKYIMKLRALTKIQFKSSYRKLLIGSQLISK